MTRESAWYGNRTRLAIVMLRYSEASGEGGRSTFFDADASDYDIVPGGTSRLTCERPQSPRRQKLQPRPRMNRVSFFSAPGAGLESRRYSIFISLNIFSVS